MIEVNLLPGAVQRRPRRARRVVVRRRAEGRVVDYWLIGIILAWTLAIGSAGWMHLGSTDRLQELELAITQAVQDSTRYATMIARDDQLRARRDSVAERLVLIQEVDAGRYIWPHLLDEISRALPEYTWITRISATGDSGTDSPTFQLTGRTGNTFALTRFLKDLEASPFIREVQLTRTESVRDQSERMVHEFILKARYEEPPLEILTTVPLQLGAN